MFELKDQVVLITGGSNGIGAGITRVMAQAGAHVIIGDIDESNGQQLAKELNGDFYKLDVTKRDMVEDVVNKIVEKHGKIDVLCSNTGIYPQAMIENMSEADFDKVMAVNLKGTFNVVQPVLAVMKNKGYGRVVLTSSITGPVTGYPGWAHYGASKAGQLGFMRSAALEYAKFGITINAVQPGNILIESLKLQGEEYIKGVESIVPTHKLGKPEDIGYAALYLASKEAAYVTGQTIIIDGGQILPEEPSGIL